MRQDVYNMLDEEDWDLQIDYLSGRQQLVHFFVVISQTIADMTEAQKMFDSEIYTENPY